MLTSLSNNELLMIAFLVGLSIYLFSNGGIVEGMPPTQRGGRSASARAAARKKWARLRASRKKRRRRRRRRSKRSGGSRGGKTAKKAADAAAAAAARVQVEEEAADAETVTEKVPDPTKNIAEEDTPCEDGVRIKECDDDGNVTLCMDGYLLENNKCNKIPPTRTGGWVGRLIGEGECGIGVKECDTNKQSLICNNGYRLVGDNLGFWSGECILQSEVPVDVKSCGIGVNDCNPLGIAFSCEDGWRLVGGESGRGTCIHDDFESNARSIGLIE